MKKATSFEVALLVSERDTGLEPATFTFLIHGVGRYNIVGKTALSNKEKQYAIDMGFRIINTNTIDYEDTFFLENVVYNELLTRGYTVFAGKTHKGEVDFVVVKNGKKFLFRFLIS